LCVRMRFVILSIKYYYYYYYYYYGLPQVNKMSTAECVTVL